jgi:hypothetical protein
MNVTVAGSTRDGDDRRRTPFGFLMINESRCFLSEDAHLNGAEQRLRWMPETEGAMEQEKKGLGSKKSLMREFKGICGQMHV